jgi:hypothetical protein
MPRTAHPSATAVILGLAASATALAAAPLLMPGSYSWLSMTTSQSAAQGIPGAWLARLGFLIFGLSVLLLAAVRRRTWPPAATALHAAFGMLMLAAAAFSTRAWQPGAAFDPTEDTMHSVAATAMGFAFALGVTATALPVRSRHPPRRWPPDAAAVLAAILLPLAMSTLPAATGALQRTMFGIAYAWNAAEALRAGAGPGRNQPDPTRPSSEPPDQRGASRNRHHRRPEVR